jgi:iron-sulfur cluster repair protein YtfE (RIC family)
MAHECGCHSGGATRSTTLPMIMSEQTVGDVVHHDPGTLEVMKDMGINHCCGAQLTLAEAAASAGVPLDTLLKALNETRKAPA